MYIFFNNAKRVFHKYIIEPMIRKALGKCGSNVRIGNHADFYGINNIFVGNDVGIGSNCTLMTTRAKIVIHDHVMFGPGITVVTGGHHYNTIGKYMDEIRENDKSDEDDKDVIFEGDNWIGANATILKGVTIGKGAIVAAGAVVVKSCPPYSIIGGNPAKVIKTRFSEEELLEHKKIMRTR